MDENSQNSHYKNIFDTPNRSYTMQAEDCATAASEIKSKDSGGAVKKKKSSGSKAKKDVNCSPGVSDGRSSRSKGGNKHAAKNSDSAFSETPKHKKSSRRVVSSDTSDMYSDFSAKMNSSDNLRNAKQKRQSSGPSSNLGGHAGASAFSFSPSGKDPNITGKRDSIFRSKTPDYKGTPNKPNTSVKKSNSFKKPSKFEPYIPLFQVQQGLKRGEFIEGALRINPRSYEDAYVSSPDGKMDIYIGGMHNRNRALNGDLVVVQINPKQEWKVLCDAIKDYQEKSGESIVDTVCRPIPSPPCKVHTPDKFQRSRPVSSNSWGSSACGERLPDTVEILGLDKLAKQLDGLAVVDKGSSKLKSRRKSKLDSNFKEGNRDKNSAACSPESSEDCLDKYSPSYEHYASPKNAVYQEVDSQILKIENSPVVSNLKTSETTYPLCDMNDIGTFDLDMKQNQDTSQAWEADESSLNIIVSPEELLSIDGDSLLDPDYISKLENYESASEVEGIIVAPGDLSGDEFTDSASIDSSHSQSLNQIIEDAAFLACQQDADNNNVALGNNYNDNVLCRFSTDYPGIISTPNTVTQRERSIEMECKIQQNKTIPPLSCVEVCDDTVVCAAVAEIPLSKDHSSSDENINAHPLIIGQFHATDQVNSIDTPIVKSNKKSKRKKKKKKQDKKEENFNVNLNLKNTNFDVSQLTVDDLLKHDEWPRFVQKTGKVVYILERKHSCIAAGHLKLCQDKNSKWALFSPNDSRVPRIMIPMSDCPANFYNRPHDFAKDLFLAQIVEWNETSTFASGHLIKNLGSTGDVETETYGILTENGVDDSKFSDEVLNCLPQDENWNIPLHELKKRKDFRKHCVFTIDPSTARDMDDAVSCRLLDNGNYEVAVHIADVTYFVKEGTPLDKVAQSRSTSVYLVQKVVPMLPRLLCDNLCSLKPGKDRLAFSIGWEMTPEGEILKQWIERTVIHSCVKLSYEHAQSMIESTSTHFDAKEYPEVSNLYSLSDVAKHVRELHSLALALREKRFSGGALKLDQVKLQFTLDKESGLPSGFKIYEQKDSNRLIEEFMLLANMAVAKQIYDTFPSLAMLRRHPEPKLQVMDDIISMCESMGIILDASSSGALQKSIAQYQGDDYLSKARAELLMNLCSRPMNCALYFCTGTLENESMFRHYALNVPLYTHFTSPIRRYPDVIVHRLLGASLGYNPPPCQTSGQIQICANHCNDKKYNAKRVSDMSDEMFLAAFIREIGSVGAKAMVLGVMDHSFDCLILEMGIVKRVYCNQLPLVEKKFKRSHGVSRLNIFWKDPSIETGLEQVIVIFALVDVVLTVERETLQIKVVLNKPEQL